MTRCQSSHRCGDKASHEVTIISHGPQGDTPGVKMNLCFQGVRHVVVTFAHDRTRTITLRALQHIQVEKDPT